MPLPAPCPADREGRERRTGSLEVVLGSVVSLSSWPCCFDQTDIKITVISCTQRGGAEHIPVTEPQGAVRTRHLHAVSSARPCWGSQATSRLNPRGGLRRSPEEAEREPGTTLSTGHLAPRTTL